MKNCNKPFARTLSMLALSATGLSALAFNAQAKLPPDIAVERVSPTRIAVVWTGALAADDKLDLAISDDAGTHRGQGRQAR